MPRKRDIGCVGNRQCLWDLAVRQKDRVARKSEVALWRTARACSTTVPGSTADARRATVPGSTADARRTARARRTTMVVTMASSVAVTRWATVVGRIAVTWRATTPRSTIMIERRTRMSGASRMTGERFRSVVDCALVVRRQRRTRAAHAAEQRRAEGYPTPSSEARVLRTGDADVKICTNHCLPCFVQKLETELWLRVMSRRAADTSSVARCGATPLK